MTRTILRRTGFAAAAATSLLVLAGCGGNSSSTADNPPSSTTTSSSPTGDSSSKPPAAAAVITIKSFAYSGASSVKPGTMVTVKNEDSEAHTVTADAGSAFDVTIDPGASATFTAPTKPGDYAYHCTFHSNMHGTLTVG